ncbi:hypothetical protein NE237_027034 [Protea cynaroides]|uniref:BSD domain-containing protein n=1 Tax=Protea cynaroides TaxID=273540 RepID=A0A9Q0GQI6_9MAGN|nr:hypothetical protein NE237_027034 [Protea cynaroides]
MSAVGLSFWQTGLEGLTLRINLKCRFMHQYMDGICKRKLPYCYIFAEKPAVHQAYLNFVPSKMSEKDFWTKYCRAEYLHRTKNLKLSRRVFIFRSTLDMEADEGDDYMHLLEHLTRIERAVQVTGVETSFHRVWTLGVFLYWRFLLLLSAGDTIEMELGDRRTVAEALTSRASH